MLRQWQQRHDWHLDDSAYKTHFDYRNVKMYFFPFFFWWKCIFYNGRNMEPWQSRGTLPFSFPELNWDLVTERNATQGIWVTSKTYLYRSPSMLIILTGVTFYFVISYNVGMLMPLHIKTDTIINYFSLLYQSRHYIYVFLLMCVGGLYFPWISCQESKD